MTNFPHGIASHGMEIVGLLPIGKNSRHFFVDTVYGDDGNSGLSANKPLKSVTAAYNKCVAERNDVVHFIAGDTADNPAETLTWAKDYTHLVGHSTPLPGRGQRCRIVGTAALDLSPVLTVSASGCLFMNVQVYNGKDANTDSGAVDVTGSRNAFLNTFFAGMGHATPAARAGSYSLKVTGSENFFERCTVGLQTIIRAAANGELLIAGGADNRFWDCDIISFSDTAGKFAAIISDTMRSVEFKDCLFFNMSTNWSQALTNALSISENETHYVILRGQNQFVGFTGISDVVTHIYGAGAAPNAGMFLSTQPTT